MDSTIHVAYSYSIIRLCQDSPRTSHTRRRSWSVQRNSYKESNGEYLRYPSKADAITGWFSATNARIAKKQAKRYLKLNINKFKEQVQA
ncbi:hypothetical protein AVT69_gp303 [Pseudomonas phage PhiPA3]|uniref:Uncharacterized protein 305 n=1 Tax=Pseudomonas phage PhiPA3 TaxID=998086 RepID=F8SJE1_BPPA3|nr:hypothetical protein AVT69_gp303 [Pseudomonas phage PhiPA3]AEH03728.1 hypothetical protein [Pseudomonas phage PhiPA3]